MSTQSFPEPAFKLCQEDNWDHVLDDPAPRAVRWALRTLTRMFNDPDWGRWHYTEGNGGFTACGRAIVPFMVDGSPQEAGLEKVECRTCLDKMRPFSRLLGLADSDDDAPSKPAGPAWQADYQREYARTSGQSATFSPMETGGWTTLETTHDDGVPRRSRVRKGQVAAMTERLRARPDFVEQPDADIIDEETKE